MLDKHKFVELVFCLARERGCKIESNNNNMLQIDFGNKKLHEGHISKMYPMALMPGANISQIINEFAPGRTCTHKPMREIINKILNDQQMSETT